MRGGRWISSSVVPKQEDALVSAERQFMDRKCEGVRVMRNWARADGMMDETEVFKRTRNVQEEETVSVAQVESAPPPCVEIGEYYGFDSRLLINRLFRSYLDQAYLTPTEILHDSREFKRLQDKGVLVSGAVDRVSTLQSRQTGGDAKQRRNELFKAVEDMSFRVRKAEKLALPQLQGNFSSLFKQLPKDDEDPDFLALIVLSRSLLSIRNWAGKLEKLCKLALDEDDKSPETHAIDVLDQVIADVLGSNIVQDILGWQPNLGQAIIRILDLADGQLPESANDAGESSGLLNALLGAGRLPLSKKCLVERAHRQLRSSQPLNRAEPSKEQDSFKQLVERVLLPSGFYDGAETADALTARYSRMIEQGGAVGRRNAISGTFRLMPDKVAGIIYLAEIMKMPSTAEFADVIQERFEDILFVRHISDLCIKGLSGRDRLARATGAYIAIDQAPLENSLKQKILERIDAIIYRFLVDEQILEKMNDPKSHLRDRAMRLINFCASGILPPKGKARTNAAERVVELLRQPNFEMHFIDGITSAAQAQQSLRDFHQLLVQAGLKG